MVYLCTLKTEQPYIPIKTTLLDTTLDINIVSDEEGNFNHHISHKEKPSSTMIFCPVTYLA